MQAPDSRLLHYPIGQRPFGDLKIGRSVEVYVNAFVISRLPSRKFYHYDVFVDKEIKDPHRAQEIIERLQTRAYPHIFRPRAAFDGRKNMYTSKRIDQGGLVEFSVPMSDAPNPSPASIIRVQLKWVADIPPIIGNLNSVIEAYNPNDSSPWQPAVNLLQVLLRQAPLMRRSAYNRISVFDPSSRKLLGGGFELWRGFFQSVRPTIEKMIVNVDITTAVIYRDINVIEWCLQYLDVTDMRYLQSLTPQTQQWRMLKQALRKVRVIAKTPTNRHNNGRPIKDLIERGGEYEFDKDGQTTTVKEYFRTQHGIHLQHPALFGIRIEGRRADILPAEVCFIEAGQMYKKHLTQAMTTKVREYSTRRPDVRLREIRTAVNGQFLNYSQSDFVSGVDMTIDPHPMRVQGRILTPPAIQFQSESVRIQDEPGAWKIRPQKFFRSRKSNWAVLNFSSLSPQDVSNFISNLKTTCESLGMSVVWSQGSIRGGSSQGGVVKALEETFRQTPQPTLIVIILPDQVQTIPQRKIIKVWGDTVKKVATQCVMEGKIKGSRANNSYCVNVAMKLNVRLGGINSVAMNAIYQKLKAAPCMIVGADVGHAGPGIYGRPSITSLVSSYENTFVRYASFCRIQHPRQEIIDNLKPMMVEALHAFYYNNPTLRPDNKGPPLQTIFFYRDGVSEGEYGQVFEAESSGKGAHHIRFFPDSNVKDNVCDRSGNVHAGFVVDTVIANPTVLDFYLQSHSGLLGTSRPGHYIVLKKADRVTIDDLQELSFYLCHAYARAARSVSIPAPVYYADLVCERANYYFSEELLASEMSSMGDRTQPFDLEKWEKGFRPPGPESMYFV
ncbi:Piwi-domain-containing protein [Auriscalpium vulgare]|uniref:Piwi-domain-containing protein n=1 Tax=Auriscalpium vulgare TaxID=40419 RepID=A0ACB8RXB3_9AGAM|nr:Piwi-domain-containing protein [Auriscalpium vulgare]